MWHLLVKNSNLQYRLFILKQLIFERCHHYFITFCITTKKGKYKQTKIILKWNSIFFSRCDLTTITCTSERDEQVPPLLPCWGSTCGPFWWELTMLWLRDGSRYQIGKNSKRPLTPPPSFLENHIAIFYNGYGRIYARRHRPDSIS